jgi:hypothetical protein
MSKVIEKSEVLEEFKQARAESRQPNCPYCGEPLNEVRQRQAEIVIWDWNEVAMEYDKNEDSESDAPYCRNCGAEDWDFVADEQDFITF